MIERQGEKCHRANRNHVVNNRNALLDCARAENSNLRLIDDGSTDESSEHTKVRNRECPSLNIIGQQLLVTCPGRKVVHRARKSEKVFLFRILDDGNDQAIVRCNRKSKVDKILLDDLVPFNRGVDQGIFLERIDNGLYDIRRVCQLEAFLRFECGRVRSAMLHNVRHIHFMHSGNMRRGVNALHHVLSHFLQHIAHLQDVMLRRGILGA